MFLDQIVLCYKYLKLLFIAEIITLNAGETYVMIFPFFLVDFELCVAGLFWFNMVDMSVNIQSCNTKIMSFQCQSDVWMVSVNWADGG